MGGFFIGMVLLAAALIGYVFLVYNRLVDLKQNVKAAWSSIDVLLKQRHDELPKLVSACREHMKFEQDVLEKVIKARSQVSFAMQSGDMAELCIAESTLCNSLDHLFASTENYPAFQADESFIQLQSSLTSLEKSIADRRERYNDAVKINNLTIDKVPTNIVATVFKFTKAMLFEVSEEELIDVKLDQLFAA